MVYHNIILKVNLPLLETRVLWPHLMLEVPAPQGRTYALPKDAQAMQKISHTRLFLFLSFLFSSSLGFPLELRLFPQVFPFINLTQSII